MKMEKIKLGFASDHRGYELKQELIDYFKTKDYIIDITDCGTDSSISCDYPDYAIILGHAITNKIVDFGVSICGSGIGISIAMNKIKGVYCAKVSSSLEARYTRLDNDTNCVAISADTPLEKAKEIVETFIKTDFSNLDRHKRRIEKVKKIEENLYD